MCVTRLMKARPGRRSGLSVRKRDAGRLQISRWKNWEVTRGLRALSRSKVKAITWLTVAFVSAAFVPPAFADKPPKDPGHSGNSGQSANQAPGSSGGNSAGSANSGNPSNPGNSGKADSGNHNKPQDTSGTHAKSRSPGNSTTRGSSTKHLPAPDATLVSKSKAYGRYCRNQSKRHVPGQIGTSFSRCLTAMAKLATGVTKFAWTACKPLSKKPIPGQTGSPFSRCVVAGARLLEALQKS
jgi:hypothetical protein